VDGNVHAEQQIGPGQAERQTFGESLPSGNFQPDFKTSHSSVKRDALEFPSQKDQKLGKQMQRKKKERTFTTES